MKRYTPLSEIQNFVSHQIFYFEITWHQWEWPLLQKSSTGLTMIFISYSLYFDLSVFNQSIVPKISLCGNEECLLQIKAEFKLSWPISKNITKNNCWDIELTASRNDGRVPGPVFEDLLTTDFVCYQMRTKAFRAFSSTVCQLGSKVKYGFVRMLSYKSAKFQLFACKPYVRSSHLGVLYGN